MPYPSLFGVVLLAVAANAQTFVVDVNNGPGTDFTTMHSATATVPSGSVLLVRAGAYDGFTIDGKSMRVLAQPGVLLQPSQGNRIDIVNLAANQQVLISNFSCTSSPGVPACEVRGANCQGRILLDDWQLVAPLQSSFSVFEFSDCDQVVIRSLQRAPGARASASFDQGNTVLEQCSFGFGFVWGLGDTIIVTGGTMQMTDCFADVQGIAPNHAVFLNNAALRVGGASDLTGAIGGAPQFAIGGTGTVRVDPSVTFGSMAIAPSLAATTVAMPQVVSSFAGGQAQAVLDGPLQQLGALLVALPGPVSTLPGIVDAFWLDASSTLFLGFGVMAPGSPVTSSFPWNGSFGPGIPVIWQGLSFDVVGGFQISPPSLLVLP